MQMYMLGFTRTTGGAGALPIVSFSTTTTARPDIREVGIFVSPTAASATIGIGRASNAYVATTSVAPQPLDAGDPAAVSSVGTAWSTAPTAPTVPFTRISLPATVGAGFVWSFQPNEFNVQGGSGVGLGLVVWQFSASASLTIDGYIKFEE